MTTSSLLIIVRPLTCWFCHDHWVYDWLQEQNASNEQKCTPHRRLYRCCATVLMKQKNRRKRRKVPFVGYGFLWCCWCLYALRWACVFMRPAHAMRHAISLSPFRQNSPHHTSPRTPHPLTPSPPHPLTPHQTSNVVPFLPTISIYSEYVSPRTLNSDTRSAKKINNDYKVNRNSTMIKDK